MKTKYVIVGPNILESGGISLFIKNIMLIDPSRFYSFSNSRNIDNSGKKIKRPKLFTVIINYCNFFLFLLKNHRQLEGVVVVTASNFVFYDSAVYILIAKLFRITSYFRYAGDIQYFYDNSLIIQKKIIQFFLRIPNKNLVQSNIIKKYLADVIGINEQKIEIIPEVIPKLRSAKNEINKPINVVFFGGLEAKRKGSSVVTQSIIDVNSSKKFNGLFHFHLVATTNNDRDTLESCNFNNVSQYSGLYGKEKEELMKRCQVLILPSYKEGMPNAILDALTYGMAVISTRVGSIPDVISEDENGFLIAPGTAKELTRTLSKLTNIKTLGKIMKNNYELSFKYSQENFASKLNEILR